jgi:glyoxylase-like metal-dependent hydrolase (beta-lactamase superfamily II)
MYFRQLYAPESFALTYLLADPRHRDAVVIDPQPQQDEILLALLAERDLRLNLVLRTHMHAQDVRQCDALCRHTGAELVIGAAASCLDAKRKVNHGDTLVFGDEVLRVLATPGHTPESMSYLWRDRLFCGDALAIRACSAADDPACDLGRMYDSVTHRLFLLPDETLVFPGHEVDGRTVSTIAEERSRNPYFANQSRDAFAGLMQTNSRRSATPDQSLAFESR